jgi:hypothetical protein
MIKDIEEKIADNIDNYIRCKNIKNICINISQVYEKNKAYFYDKVSRYDEIMLIKHDNITYIEDILDLNPQSKLKLKEFKTFCNLMLYGYDQEITINQINFVRNINISFVDEIEMIWPEIGLFFKLTNDYIEIRIRCCKKGNYILASNEHNNNNININLGKMIDELKLAMLKEVGLDHYKENHPEVITFKNKSIFDIITEQFSQLNFEYFNAEDLVKYINKNINEDFFITNKETDSLNISLNSKENKKIALMLYDKIMKSHFRESSEMAQLINLIIFYCELSNKAPRLSIDISNIPVNHTKLNNLKKITIYSFNFENCLIIDIGGHEKTITCKIVIDNYDYIDTESLAVLYDAFLNIIKQHVNETIKNDAPLTLDHLELYKMVKI